MNRQQVDRATILSLIPHQGGMCLWDAVIHWDQTRIQLCTHTHRDPQHPLRSDGCLRAVQLCEYGAQAMAVHGGLLARAQGGRAPPGLLVALRAVHLHVARIDDLPEPLQCQAEALANHPQSQQYAFRISCGTQLLAEGRATVMLQHDAI